METLYFSFWEKTSTTPTQDIFYTGHLMWLWLTGIPFALRRFNFSHLFLKESGNRSHERHLPTGTWSPREMLPVEVDNIFLGKPTICLAVNQCDMFPLTLLVPSLIQDFYPATRLSQFFSACPTLEKFPGFHGFGIKSREQKVLGISWSAEAKQSLAGLVKIQENSKILGSITWKNFNKMTKICFWESHFFPIT